MADDFSAVDGIIKKQLTSRVPLVSKIGDYITSAGGKRLRPLLVLLCGKALGVLLGRWGGRRALPLMLVRTCSS